MSALFRRGTLAPALWLGSVVLIVGCAGGKGDVTGKVSYDGKTLKGGTVTFAPADGEGPSFSGSIDENGTYTVPNVAAGEYKVCVETESLKGPAGAGGGAGGPPGMKSSKGGGGPPGIGTPDLSKVKDKGMAGRELPEGYKGDGLAIIRDNAKRYTPIPTDYANPKTTTVTYKVSSGSQTFDIDLKPK
jgi:hypothetical protein